ncbi:hypothetical protein ABEU98_30660 [Priestia megaterium]|uniref:hypothetical protein n=1 Tax=Priestia TaxID=2800373 RepID=UPI000E2F3185|nr:hypothetical protein [Priestia megaterium]MED3927975.1 hypothetical protein [Priestia megaterium]RFB17526.1 hypothetical protein DZB87_30230 [Bacillus sp. ALD]
MLSFEAFNYIKYVFIFFIIILVGLFFIINFSKYNSLTNLFSVCFISMICIVVSIFNMIFLGYAADELNYTRSYPSDMFIIIVILSIINFIFSYRKKQK